MTVPGGGPRQLILVVGGLVEGLRNGKGALVGVGEVEERLRRGHQLARVGGV